jgi:hypothetical protein
MWLSRFLSIAGKCAVSHEACEHAGNAEEFWDNADVMRPFGGHYGNSDSATIFVLPALLAARPLTKVIWIHRNMVDVCKSLKAIGLNLDQESAELILRLRDRYRECFDMIIDFEDLSSQRTVETMWYYLLPDIPFDLERFKFYCKQKICYTKEKPMPSKTTVRFVGWVQRELDQPVET